MRFYLILIALILLNSCVKKLKPDAQLNNSNDLFGNWYSAKNNDYFEYFFDKSKMYVFSTSSLDLFQFDYYVKNDSIFNSIILPSGENGEYKFHSVILEKSKTELKLSSRTLKRIVDSSATIDGFLNKKFDFNKLRKGALSREQMFSNLFKNQ